MELLLDVNSDKLYNDVTAKDVERQSHISLGNSYVQSKRLTIHEMNEIYEYNNNNYYLIFHCFINYK